MRIEEKQHETADRYVPEEAARYFTYLDPTTDEFDYRLIWPKEKGKPPENQEAIVKLRSPFQNVFPLLNGSNKQGYGVFTTVNGTDGNGVKVRNVTSIRAVFADWDKGIPSSLPLPPSMLVETSPGKAQGYWLIADEMAPAQFNAILSCLVSAYGADPAAKDVARVLRVPGFNHTKGEPYPVKLRSPAVGEKPKRYLTKQLIDAFPAPAKREPKKSPSDAISRLGAIINSGGSFDEDRIAEALSHVPADQYETWCEIGMALHHSTGGSEQGFEIWDAWSKGSPKYDATVQQAKWESFSAENYDGPTLGLGTLFMRATEHGWIDARKISEAIVVPAELVEQTIFEESALEWGTKLCREKAEAKDAWKPKELGELMQRMNADHSVVDIGGKVLVTKIEANPLTGKQIVFMPTEAARKKYAAVVVGGTENRPITAFNKWERWPGRRYYEGVGMFPGSLVKPSSVPRNYLNLWGGLQITPRKGDWSLVRNHMLMMCGGNEDHLDWFLDWNAQLLQEPQRKPGSAIVLRSSQKGTGKSMFAGFWQKMFGTQHVATVTSSEQITGRFNAVTGQSVLVFLEEASWGGSKTAGNALKERITGGMTTLERKGLDPIVQPNYTRYWFNSNEDWIVPAGTDERRYFIADFEFERANDRKYFDPLFKQMLDEDGLEAMAHELLARKIESDLYTPPTTQGLQRQREYSLGGVERFMFETAKSGQLPKEDILGRSYELGDNPLLVPTSEVQSAARSYCDEYEGRALDTRLGQMLSEVGVNKARRVTSASRGYFYQFPAIEEFRERVGKRLNLPIVEYPVLEGANRL